LGFHGYPQLIIAIQKSPKKLFHPQITQISADKSTGNPDLPSNLMRNNTLSGKASKICVNLRNLWI